MHKNRFFFVLLLVILLFSVSSYRMIPWGDFLGLDFQNLHAFHRCPEAAIGPYAVSGTRCGDALGRGMLYPPFLYWSFAWTRAFDFITAYRIWALAVGGGTLVSVSLWLREERASWRGWVLGLLLLGQFPLAYALERGNNDVAVLLLWSLSAAAMLRGRATLSGIAAGACTAYKVYPGLSLVWVGWALIRRQPRWCVGAALAFLVFGFAAPQSWIYWSEVLPEYARGLQIIDMTNHPIGSMYQAFPVARWLIQGAVFFALLIGTGRSLRGGDPLGAFAGALAASTYFSTTSNDYNLITAYPLLALSMSRGVNDSMRWRAAALLGVLGVVGHRYWYFNTVFKSAEFHTWVQLVWLAYSGWVLGHPSKGHREAASRSRTSGSGSVMDRVDELRVSP